MMNNGQTESSTTPKMTVAVFFGGESAEHEVSLRSAKNIVSALDQTKYRVVLIYIDQTGGWYLIEDENLLKTSDSLKKDLLRRLNRPLALVPGKRGRQLIDLENKKPLDPIDAAFPVLHGPNGEDGTIQGLFRLARIPFVGPDVLSSAVAMDKDTAKRLFRDAGLLIADFLTFNYHHMDQIDFNAVKDRLGLPLFVKPAAMGSSVGITKVSDPSQFKKALQSAFEYDDKIVTEQYIAGREIECSVLGNEHPTASVPGEIIPRHEFYSYRSKYIDEQGAELIAPADLAPVVRENIQKTAIRAYQALCCEGMARVDFFLTDQNKIILNEINTIPGFTSISMYPKLWEETDLPYARLIDRLIQLAVDRFAGEQRIKAVF